MYLHIWPPPLERRHANMTTNASNHISHFHVQRVLPFQQDFVSNPIQTIRHHIHQEPPFVPTVSTLKTTPTTPSLSLKFVHIFPLSIIHTVWFRHQLFLHIYTIQKYSYFCFPSPDVNIKAVFRKKSATPGRESLPKQSKRGWNNERKK